MDVVTLAVSDPSPIMAFAASKCSDTIAFISVQGGKNIILWLNNHGSIVMF